jgi:hypothetical protein
MIRGAKRMKKKQGENKHFRVQVIVSRFSICTVILMEGNQQNKKKATKCLQGHPKSSKVYLWVVVRKNGPAQHDSIHASCDRRRVL